MKRVVALGAALALAIVLALALLAGFDRRVERRPVLGYPSVSEVADFDLLSRSYQSRVAAGSNPKLVFGSSELNPGPAGPAHPASLLEGGRYGIDVMVTGRAFCEDLWQAIEVGAFAGQMKDKKVVLIPSMQWFMCYRDPSRNFQAAYSSGAYDAFMANSDISAATKRAVTDRMARYGVDRSGEGKGLARVSDALDRWASSAAASLRLALGWDDDASQSVQGGSAPVSAGGSSASRVSAHTSIPDWDAIFNQAYETASTRAAGNDMGVDAAWAERDMKRWLDGASKWKVRDGEYFSGEELADFELLLDVCREAGVEPLVLIQPVKGPLYDQTVYTRDVREQYYRMIRDACEKEGVPVADFSGHEYDTYFLREYSHPSDLGGAYYSKAIYTYFTTGEADTSPSGGVGQAGGRP